MQKQIVGSPHILRLDQVKTKTGLSRSSIYSFSKIGTFPKGLNLGPRAVGWLESEIDMWLAGRAAARELGVFQ